jgi:hypothetical protein
VRWAILSDAYTVPVGALAWNPDEKSFQLLTGTKHRRIRLSGETICASELASLLVYCDGYCCGYFEEVFFDVTVGQLDLFAIEHHGIRVLPWSLVNLVTVDDKPQAQLTCSMSTVASAPILNGATGESIHNSAFRSKVKALPLSAR